MVFYCIFINKFCKNFGGRVHFYPPLTSPSPPPAPPVCIYELVINKFNTNLTQLLQLKPLNVITLGQTETDPNNRMITLSVITLSGLYCNTNILVVLKPENQF